MIRFLIGLLLMTEAMAQPAPDPKFLQHAVGAMQVQRNQAMDALASAQAQVQMLTEENARLKEEIKRLTEGAKK